MVTRKHTRKVWLVPLALLGTLAVVVAGASGGGPLKPQNNYEKWQRYLATRQPTGLERLRDTTHRPVNPKPRAALERLQKASHQKWQVTWDSTTGCAALLQWGRIWCVGATRKAQATNLISDYIDLFWQPDPRFRSPKPEFKEAGEPGGGVDFDMYSQGLRVFRAGLTVGFERTGEVSTIGANAPILPEIGLSPKLTPQQAADVVRKKEKVPTGARVPDSPELVIFPSNPPRLMYSVFVDGGAHLLVDANSGEIYPGMWTGPMEYGPAGTGPAGKAVSPVVPDSVMRDRRGIPRRSIPTSLEYVKEKYRAVTGQELDWHEHQVVPPPQPKPEAQQLGGGGTPTSPDC